ncbi:hypothetical protein [Thermogemmatispora onikobensis]|uniref:hypothetical protein n=1 Tax=Thermogemmatispora onikobensis TaxID=732234 RepID=UPI000853955E|nr:hypothetical protein [Thermogemmatispora onikobensis]
MPALLEKQVQHLQEQISNARPAIERGERLGVDRFFLTEDLYTLALLETKLTVVRQLIQEINDGTLTEVSGGRRIWEITRPELASPGSETGQESEHTSDSSNREDSAD